MTWFNKRPDTRPAAQTEAKCCQFRMYQLRRLAIPRIEVRRLDAPEHRLECRRPSIDASQARVVRLPRQEIAVELYRSVETLDQLGLVVNGEIPPMLHYAEVVGSILKPTFGAAGRFARLKQPSAFDTGF